MFLHMLMFVYVDVHSFKDKLLIYYKYWFLIISVIINTLRN